MNSPVIVDLREHRLKREKEKESKSFQAAAVHVGWNQAGL